MRGLKENSIPQKILIEIDRFLEETALPLLIWDFDTITKTTGIRSIYRDYSLRPLLAKYIYDLKRRNYIQETRTKKGREIQLTPKGQTEIIKYKIKLKTKKPRWDKKWRAICWDVPEISRKDRDYLRGKLRWLGFKELQKSLWIFPFNIKEEVKELVKLYKEDLAGDIRFLTIEKIENDSDLKEHFNL